MDVIPRVAVSHIRICIYIYIYIIHYHVETYVDTYRALESVFQVYHVQYCRARKFALIKGSSA